MTDTMTELVMAECRHAVAKAKENGGGVPEMFAAAAPLARNHWMVLDEDEQFRGAVAAVYVEADPEDQVRMLAEIEKLKILAAAMSGVPVDWNAMLPAEGEETPKAFGLSAIWRDSA